MPPKKIKKYKRPAPEPKTKNLNKRSNIIKEGSAVSQIIPDPDNEGETITRTGTIVSLGYDNTLTVNFDGEDTEVDLKTDNLTRVG